MTAKRHRPEFDTVVVPIRKELENAGFRVRFIGKTHRAGTAWISNVPNGLPDVYAYHPERKVSVWIEAKAPGKPLRPGQRAFIEDHAGSETQAVCWDDLNICVEWLHLNGLRCYDADGKAQYPAGIHRVPDHNVTEEQEWQS